MAKHHADWRSEALGPARILELDGGRMRVHVTGEGPAIVFVHGVLVNANLWRKLVPRLDGFTSVTLDLPLGAHLLPMPARPLTVPDAAALIGEAVEALGLEGVTLVGNDTGGALCQVAAAPRPDWLGRLALTSCDALEHFPPDMLRPVLPLLKRPAVLGLAMQTLRLRALRGTRVAYGLAVGGSLDHDATDSWVRPAIERREIREDVCRLLADVAPHHTLAAAEALRAFDRPALIAWSADERFFPRSDAERLAAIIPGARLELIEGARTFSMEDRPARLAELIAGFVREPVGGVA